MRRKSVSLPFTEDISKLVILFWHIRKIHGRCVGMRGFSVSGSVAKCKLKYYGTFCTGSTQVSRSIDQCNAWWRSGFKWCWVQCGGLFKLRVCHGNPRVQEGQQGFRWIRQRSCFSGRRLGCWTSMLGRTELDMACKPVNQRIVLFQPIITKDCGAGRVE